MFGCRVDARTETLPGGDSARAHRSFDWPWQTAGPPHVPRVMNIGYDRASLGYDRASQCINDTDTDEKWWCLGQSFLPESHEKSL